MKKFVLLLALMFVFSSPAYCDMNIEITIPTAHVPNLSDMLEDKGYPVSVAGFKDWVRDCYKAAIRDQVSHEKAVEAEAEITTKAVGIAIQ